MDGHYMDIHGIIPHRDSVHDRSSGYDHYQYIDVDHLSDGDHPGSGDQAARSQGYEGLDTSDLATLRQPQKLRDYAGLGAGEAAASTQQTTEEIEMTQRHYQNTVSRYYVLRVIVVLKCTRRDSIPWF